MNWIPLETVATLEEIANTDNIVVIFKHSTRCSVSSMAKRSLEYDKELFPSETPIYYLDLIAHRDISNQVAELWNVKHQSPQILVVKGRECLYHASHSDIEMQDIIKYLN